MQILKYSIQLGQIDITKPLGLNISRGLRICQNINSVCDYLSLQRGGQHREGPLSDYYQVFLQNGTTKGSLLG